MQEESSLDLELDFNNINLSKDLDSFVEDLSFNFQDGGIKKNEQVDPEQKEVCLSNLQEQIVETLQNEQEQQIQSKNELESQEQKNESEVKQPSKIEQRLQYFQQAFELGSFADQLKIIDRNNIISDQIQNINKGESQDEKLKAKFNQNNIYSTNTTYTGQTTQDPVFLGSLQNVNSYEIKKESNQIKCSTLQLETNSYKQAYLCGCIIQENSKQSKSNCFIF